MRLAGLIIEARKRKGLKSAELARLAEVSPSTITRLEKGETAAGRGDTLARIARVLNIPPEEMQAVAREEEVSGYRRPPEQIAEELLAALRRSQESLPIMVYPLENQRISAGPGAPMDSSPFPYYPREGERGHRFVWVKVSGTCMEPRIHEGDIVVVDQDASPQHGSIVAALHDGEALVKMLEKRNADTFLVALRKQRPIKVNSDTRILGVVTFVGNWL